MYGTDPGEHFPLLALILTARARRQTPEMRRTHVSGFEPPYPMCHDDACGATGLPPGVQTTQAVFA